MIKFELKDETGILKLNRPEKRNALHPDLVKQVKEKLKEIEKDEKVKVLIITGSGKAFCAGADLGYLNQLRDYSVLQNEEDSKMLAELFLTIYKFPKPVIAAVNGAAIAGGCGQFPHFAGQAPLARTADFRITHYDRASREGR